ncbi:hypothetical protein D3C86_1199400 [compost metagenome]
MNVEERLDLQHGADAVVAGAFVSALEQPAVDLLAFELTGFDDVLEGGVGVGQQVAHHPQVQRVHFGDEALIRQVVSAGAIGIVEPHKAIVGELLGELGACQVRAHEGIEAFLAGPR